MSLGQAAAASGYSPGGSPNIIRSTAIVTREAAAKVRCSSPAKSGSVFDAFGIRTRVCFFGSFRSLLHLQPNEVMDPPRYSSMLGREQSVGAQQARAEFSKLREELSRTLSGDGTDDGAHTGPPPPPPPPAPQAIVPKPILASQV